MKYLRTYPLFMQILLFMLLVFTLFWFVTLLQLYFLPKLTGYSTVQLLDLRDDSPKQLIQASLLAQGITHFSLFLLPAMVFGYLAHPQPRAYLGLKPVQKPAQLLAVTLLALGMLPLMLQIASWSRLIPGADQFKALQERSELVMKLYLSQHTVAGLTLALVVMAVLPALGEELFFRGLIMRFSARATRWRFLPVLISAVFFTAVHVNPYGTGAIFLAGIVLGLVYLATGSIWLSIWAHFLINGLQVVLAYWDQRSQGAISQQAPQMPWSVTVAGLAAFVLAGWWLYKLRTPLPRNWPEDGGRDGGTLVRNSGRDIFQEQNNPDH